MSNFIQVLAQLIANLLQRAFGTKPNTLLTVTGVVAALAALLAALPPSIVPVKYQPWLTGAAMFFSLLAGALGYGQKANASDPTPPPKSPKETK